MRLEFGDVRVKDGFIRFLDRTTQPAFSQDLSRLELTVTGFGNQPDRRAKVTLQSVVGGDAGLDIRGELNALGAPTFVDLVGELRSFKLPSVDPYVTSNIGWVIKKGELQYKVRFKLEGDQLSADNELVVGQLQVAPASGSDEVKQRLGLPLGLIVALIKDQKGDIRVNVPVTGTVNDPQFKLGDAIWTAVKNVLVNVVTAPFKAIGRLFSRDGGDKVESAQGRGAESRAGDVCRGELGPVTGHGGPLAPGGRRPAPLALRQPGADGGGDPRGRGRAEERGGRGASARLPKGTGPG